jgi:hypothetical protein
MEILKFKDFFEEKDIKADTMTAMTSFLGIDPKNIDDALKEPFLVSQLPTGNKQVSISPFYIEPIMRDGNIVGAKFKIKGKQTQPWSYIYINNMINKHRNDPIVGFTNRNDLDALFYKPLQQS